MPRPRELLATLPLAAALVSAAAADPARGPSNGGTPFDAGSFGKSKEPIIIVSDRLEYDYKANVVVYRGDVLATQGEMKVRSDTLTATFASDGTTPQPANASTKGTQRLQEVVAVGNVRIDNGTRWAIGGRAVFEQGKRTVVLTENPVLHDGSNEVAGDRVVVYLDENRSIVEGGRKRVKAVLYPNKDGSVGPGAPPKDQESAAHVDASELGATP